MATNIIEYPNNPNDIHQYANDINIGIQRYIFKDKVNSRLVADALLSEFKFITYRETKSIFFYEHGIYKPNGIEFIKREVRTRLGTYFRKNHSDEVIEHIRIECTVELEKINAEKHLINLNNGIFDTKEWTFKPHDPSFLSTVRIPVDYDPDAKCSVINYFLDSCVSAEDKQTLLEWAGLMLVPETKFEKFMLLHGISGSGKSTFINLLTALVGKPNTSSIPLQKLVSTKDKFYIASLHNKLMNQCADIESSTIYDTAMIKQLTGKDLITGEKKFENCFNFYNTARLLFSCNTAPNLHNKEDTAFYERLLIIEFNNKFRGTDKEDKNLEGKLTSNEELSGFLNLALAGLKAILKNGRFTNDRSAKDTADLYTIKSNPVFKFAEDCIVSSPNNTLKTEIYAAYCNWCLQNELGKPLASNIFGQKMKALGYLSDQLGDRMRYYESIALRGKNSISKLSKK
jgi:putative DNA primase/helicase